MIRVQKQQKQQHFPNWSQRRTPLNVVVEKIGTTHAVVHGDLSKESLKELLMSELSLISKIQTPETKDSTTLLENKSLTQGVSEIIAKGDKENISEKSKSEEEERELKIGKEEKMAESDKEEEELKSAKDQMKIGKTLQEKDKNVTKEFQKSQKDIFENEVTKKGKKEDEDMKNKTGKNDKTISSDEIRKDEIQEGGEEKNGFKGNEKIMSGSEVSFNQRKVEKLTKKGDMKDQDKEKDFGNDTKIDKKREDKKYQDKEKVTLKYQSDKKAICKTENILQEKRKKEEPDHSVQYLFRKTDSKAKGKKCMSKKEKRGTGRAIMKEKDSRLYDDIDEMEQIEKISDSKDFRGNYKKEDRESCFSKISFDKEDVLSLSYDGKWLRQYLKKPLIFAMNEIVEKKPKDPVNYLGFWLLNYRNSQEKLQRAKNLEEELLSKRNERNMLHAEVKKTRESIIEAKESECQEEEENKEDWNFSDYGFK